VRVPQPPLHVHLEPRARQLLAARQPTRPLERTPTGPPAHEQHARVAAGTQRALHGERHAVDAHHRVPHADALLH
jgi:hypothetical protein